MKIVCKHCGSHRVDLTKVDVFEMFDEGEAFHTTVEYDAVKRENTSMILPGTGRFATEIGFQCDECDQRTVIGVAQNRGITIVAEK